MKTTKKDFELFKRYHQEWSDKLGIKNWSQHYMHTHLDDVYAKTYMDIEGMVSNTVLSNYWDDLRPKTEAEIKSLALHEALHLIMRPLTHEAEKRYTSADTILAIEHSIIRQLENIVATKE